MSQNCSNIAVRKQNTTLFYSMELRNLKAFVMAARQLNFSEAARQLCVTQSTLSQNIKQLENETGYALFYRNSHEVQLTEAGTELLPYAEKTIQTAEDCNHRMEDLRGLKCGQLSIGITHSFTQVLNETLKTYMKSFPNIRLNIIYRPMAELIERLQNRELDFVLCYRPDNETIGLESHILFEDHLSIVLDTDHPLAKRKNIRLAELSEFPAALPAPGLQARNVLDNILAEAQEKLNVRIEMNEVSALLRLVHNTAGIYTVLSSSAIEDIDGLTAIPIDHQGCRMEGCVQTVRGRYVKNASKEFIKILCETSLVKKRINEWIKN